MQGAAEEQPGRASLSRLRQWRWGRLGMAILIGLLFWLPHAVRMIALHSVTEYTPFSVTTPNNTVWDESFLYAAQANTMLQQHRKADDTDSWEHRDSSFPYSILPAGTEVAFARVLAPGHPREGLKRAQILFHFLFPAVMAWLLMGLLDPSREKVAMPAALALLVMVGSFSARTLEAGVLSWFGGSQAPSLLGTLQAARSPNPNVSFVIFLGAIVLLLRALRKQTMLQFAVAGLAGSMLFYSYTYYAISWCAACALLALFSLWPSARIARRVCWALTASCVGALPYLLWTHASKASGSYRERVARLGMVYSHAVTPQGIQLSLLWGSAVVVLVACWFWMRRRAAPDERRDAMHDSVVVIAAAALGGIAGMNMQVITGFNIQAEFHFTHMVIQPTVILLACLLVAWWQRDVMARPWIWRGAFAVFFVACTASQVSAGIHSAPFHRIHASDRALFDWLEAHSASGAVVATTNLRVDLEMPIYSHNRLLVVNGTRAAGSNEELQERLLLANRLVATSPARMLEELRGDDTTPDGVRIESYDWYLSEHAPSLNDATHNLFDAALPALMQRYQQMDLPQELQRFHVDYIYTRDGQPPAAIAGWRSEQVLRTAQGVLWQLQPDR